MKLLNALIGREHATKLEAHRLEGKMVAAVTVMFRPYWFGTWKGAAVDPHTFLAAAQNYKEGDDTLKALMSNGKEAVIKVPQWAIKGFEYHVLSAAKILIEKMQEAEKMRDAFLSKMKEIVAVDAPIAEEQGVDNHDKPTVPCMPLSRACATTWSE